MNGRQVEKGVIKGSAGGDLAGQVEETYVVSVFFVFSVRHVSFLLRSARCTAFSCWK